MNCVQLSWNIRNIIVGATDVMICPYFYVQKFSLMAGLIKMETRYLNFAGRFPIYNLTHLNDNRNSERLSNLFWTLYINTRHTFIDICINKWVKRW